MSDYQQFLDERDKIDILIQKGYRINAVSEHLNGTTVEFMHPDGRLKDTLLIGTPNARKYYSIILMKQNQGLD